MHMPPVVITGTDLPDVPLNGTINDDIISLLLGDDSSHGGDGNDTIYGGGGSDTLRGGNGNDWLEADEFGVYATDTLIGGAGDDWLFFNSGNGGSADGGGDIDTLFLNWHGGPVFDQAVSVTLTGAGANATQGATTLTIANMERLILNAANGDDTVTGGNDIDSIFVNGGANIVNALDGNDTVSYVIGEVNTLDGGTGTDILYASGDYSNVNIFTVTGTTATDQFGSVISNFERYAYTGGTLADIVTFGSGNDIAWAGEGSDTVTGGAGNDTLEGQGGNDSLSGGTGIDRLTGGLGVDTLRGGAQADVFVFTDLAEGGDLISDFAVGVDDLEFTSAALGGLVAAGGAPIVTAGAAVTGDAQFLYSYDAGTNRTTLTWDDDGNGAGGADLVASFTGNILFGAGDFIIT
jgi:serralysin